MGSAAELRQTLRVLVPHAGYTTALAAFRSVQDAGTLPAETPFMCEAERGMTWKAVYGRVADHVLESISLVDAALADWIPRCCYGEVIGSPGLTLLQTELLFVSFLVSASLSDVLYGHLVALRRFGGCRGHAAHAMLLGLTGLACDDAQKAHLANDATKQLQRAFGRESTSNVVTDASRTCHAATANASAPTEVARTAVLDCFNGKWFPSDGSEVIIFGDRIRWSEDLECSFKATSPETCETALHGKVFKGRLDHDGKLKWDDGDIWTKARASHRDRQAGGDFPAIDLNLLAPPDMACWDNVDMMRYLANPHVK